MERGSARSAAKRRAPNRSAAAAQQNCRGSAGGSAWRGRGAIIPVPSAVTGGVDVKARCAVDTETDGMALPRPRMEGAEIFDQLGARHRPHRNEVERGEAQVAACFRALETEVGGRLSVARNNAHRPDGGNEMLAHI